MEIFTTTTHRKDGNLPLDDLPRYILVWATPILWPPPKKGHVYWVVWRHKHQFGYNVLNKNKSLQTCM
jgi:hypothetical protein